MRIASASKSLRAASSSCLRAKNHALKPAASEIASTTQAIQCDDTRRGGSLPPPGTDAVGRTEGVELSEFIVSFFSYAGMPDVLPNCRVPQPEKFRRKFRARIAGVPLEF